MFQQSRAFALPDANSRRLIRCSYLCGTAVRGFLIRGSRKAADQYKRLILGAENEGDQLYRDRIAREDRAMRTLTEL